jgi:hypothetical protein
MCVWHTACLNHRYSLKPATHLLRSLRLIFFPTLILVQGLLGTFSSLLKHATDDHGPIHLRAMRANDKIPHAR